jgi:hypothetical protein
VPRSGEIRVCNSRINALKNGLTYTIWQLILGRTHGVSRVALTVHIGTLAVGFVPRKAPSRLVTDGAALRLSTAA